MNIFCVCLRCLVHKNTIPIGNISFSQLLILKRLTERGSLDNLEANTQSLNSVTKVAETTVKTLNGLSYYKRLLLTWREPSLVFRF